MKRKGERPIDAGIAREVAILQKHGISTAESCEGGPGHSFPEPTIRFFGDRSVGFRALAVALQHGLPVRQLRRYWSIQHGEPTGPYWEITFSGRGLERVQNCPKT